MPQKYISIFFVNERLSLQSTLFSVHNVASQTVKRKYVSTRIYTWHIKTNKSISAAASSKQMCFQQTLKAHNNKHT